MLTDFRWLLRRYPKEVAPALVVLVVPPTLYLHREFDLASPLAELGGLLLLASAVGLLQLAVIVVAVKLVQAMRGERRRGVIIPRRLQDDPTLSAAVEIHKRRLEQDFARQREAWLVEREEWKAQKMGELYEQIMDQFERGKLTRDESSQDDPPDHYWQRGA